MPAAKPQKKRMNLTKKADALFSKITRAGGVCEIGHVSKCPSGNLQCAHGFSRRYLATRWDFRNSFSACAGCHYWFTERPLEWECFLRERWGDERYDELRALALRGPKPDFDELIPALEARLAEVSA